MDTLFRNDLKHIFGISVLHCTVVTCGPTYSMCLYICDKLILAHNMGWLIYCSGSSSLCANAYQLADIPLTLIVSSDVSRGTKLSNKGGTV